MCNRTIFVSNVGDSRAVVLSLADSKHAAATPTKGGNYPPPQPTRKLIGKPLSSDQTPYRKDERERVKKYGARILSMDQLEGAFITL